LSAVVKRDARRHAVDWQHNMSIGSWCDKQPQVGNQHPPVIGWPVDRRHKFQGQEVPVVIYSMASSSPAEAPRGVDFLYSVHRLNVANSRAQGLAMLVCSPDFDVKAHTPEQLRLANALCRLVEIAREDLGSTLSHA
jgi:hypothetical protein